MADRRTPREARANLVTIYRQMARSGYATDDEMLAQADMHETLLAGHECGHQFIITVTSILHSGIVGEGPSSHTDAEQVQDDGLTPVTVRAHDLREALRKAAALPLAAWFPEEES